jgi:hypothetical protein
MTGDRLFRCRALLAVTVGAAVVCTWVHVYAQSSTPATSLPDAIPVTSPAANQEAIDTFSWRAFVALNRPAALDGQGRPVRDDTFPNGKPDLGKPLTAPGPRVWEGLKADHELFRHGGRPPVAWDQYDDDLPCAAGPMAERSGEKILTLVSEGTSMQEGINQAMAGPLIDRFGSYVHYEVRHNKPYYDFVKSNKFYLRDELDKHHRWPRKMVQLPISDPDGKVYGSLEVKAAWRVLNPSEDDATARRYYWTWASVPDPVTGKCGPKQRVALVGLHIIQKVKGFNSWLWATFEHVDNVPCKYSDMSTCPSGPPDHYSFNAKDQSLDQEAKSNRGFWPKVWTKTKLPKWKPIDPQKLPPEPIAEEDRINAVRMLPVRDSATKTNHEFHALDGIKGTFWENYILIDTQWPGNGNGAVKPPNVGVPWTEQEYIQGALNPIPGPGPNAGGNAPVANITMETYYQQPNPSLKSLGASCMQCHYAATQTDFSWTLANRAWPPTRAGKLPNAP